MFEALLEEKLPHKQALVISQLAMLTLQHANTVLQQTGLRFILMHI